MGRLTQLFIKLGWSRNDAKWAWLQIVSVAGLISANILDLHKVAAYIDVPLSDSWVHRISAAAAAVLFIAGNYHASPLPSTRQMETGLVPGSPAAVAGVGAVPPVTPPTV